MCVCVWVMCVVSLLGWIGGQHLCVRDMRVQSCSVFDCHGFEINGDGSVVWA